MELNRRPTDQEERLIEVLINNASINFPANWKENLLVRSMNDGEMGSLYLFPKEGKNENRIFDAQVSDIQFTDQDGIEVIASLNVDKNGNLLELDIWKTDFSKLIKLPDI